MKSKMLLVSSQPMTCKPTLRYRNLPWPAKLRSVELTVREAINSLTRKLEEVRTVSTPPKKFTFKKSSRPANVASLSSTIPPSATETLSTPGKDVNEAITGPSEPEPPHLLPQETQAHVGFRLSSLDTTHYILSSSASDEASIASLGDIQRSIVDISFTLAMRASFATLTINNVKKSLLICGTIAGSAHITGIEDTTIVIMARQLRVHDCKNMVIYLRCSSRPIIEDCMEIRFAPLPSIFVGLSLRCIIEITLIDEQNY